jgi:hypothetical protein
MEGLSLRLGVEFSRCAESRLIGIEIALGGSDGPPQEPGLRLAWMAVERRKNG